MTAKDLLDIFERHYSDKYSGIFLETTLEYLDGYPADFYRAVAKVMILRFSRIYNKVPGPAEIEKHMFEILDTMPKPTPLPEPKYEISDEEMAECLKVVEEIKQIQKGKTGPLAEVKIRCMPDEYI